VYNNGSKMVLFAAFSWKIIPFT